MTGVVTGEQLHRELCAAARARGVSPQQFARPLFNEPNWKLEQMRIAKRPTQLTIDRVRALIAGAPLPPTRAGQYVRDARAFGLSRFAAEEAGIPPSLRSSREAAGLALTLERKAAVERARDLAEIARETRRPGQCLADRLRELRAEAVA